jgi:predicted nucleotidyltransferase
MDLSSYVEFHRRRYEERRERRAAAEREAREDLEAMQEVFRKTPRLRRVYLFGSLARDRFREDSDIDLAVEGLDPESYAQLCRGLRAAARREVDVVDLGQSDRGLERIIRSYGRVIYEARREAFNERAQ